MNDPLNGRFKHAVVLDTGSYRSLGSKWQTLKQRESERGIVAFASPHVAMELISHLRDSEDRAFRPCLAGLISMAHHCKHWERDNILLIADSESLVCMALFGKIPPAHAETTEVVARVIKAVGDNPRQAISQHADAIQAIGGWIDKRESQFIEDLLAIPKHFDPNIMTWAEVAGDEILKAKVSDYIKTEAFLSDMCLAQVSQCAEFLDLKLPVPKRINKANEIRANFSAPLEMYREILAILAQNPAYNVSDPEKKRANFLWDMAILSTAGPGTLGGIPVTLVSTDKAVRRAGPAVPFYTYIRDLI